MAVTRRQAAAVIDDHQLPITVLPTDERHSAARSRDDWRAPRCFNVLARMKLVTWPTERIAPAAETTFECAVDRPNRRRVTAFAQNRLVRAQVFLEPAHLCDHGCESHLVQGQGGTTAPGQWLVIHHTGLFGELARRVFYSLDAVVEFFEFLPLAFVLGTQALIFKLRAQVRGLLRKPVKAVTQTDCHRRSNREKHGYYFLLNADSLNSGF